MASIAVTGSSGAVGRRVLNTLVDEPSVDRLVAIARRPQSPPTGNRQADDDSAPPAEVESLRLDLGIDDPAPAFHGADTVIHLADDHTLRTDPRAATAILDRVLGAMTAAGCRHLVLSSSALVYGARSDNPVPITEAQPIAPVRELGYAVAKARLEERAARWAAENEAGLAVLRPVAALSEGDSSWIGSALRAAAVVRAEQVDPPVQFLHHDDLAAALTLAGLARLDGPYNVAPDGWIGNDEFRALRGEASIRIHPRLSRVPLRAAKAVADRRLLDGLEPYVTWSWVVANDRLRAEGWAPQFTNAEAWVAGTPPPLLGLVSGRRRQEIALGAASVVGAAAVGGAWLAVRGSAARWRR
ncbi:MAG: NAD-dependent epimerase/dehydratase family protein [Actinomycetota bacterium]